MERGPQMPAQMLEEELRDSDWNWGDIDIDNISDLRRYIAASKMTVQQFMQLNIYKKNVGKVKWIKELENI